MNAYGVVKEFPRTGKKERPKKPRVIPPEDLKYPKCKTRKEECLKKREESSLENIEQNEASTTLIERQNLTSRKINNRFQGETIGFLKVKEWLEHQMKLYCTHFTLRGHGGLRYKDERGVECKKHCQSSRLQSQTGLLELLTFRFFKHQSDTRRTSIY